MEPQKPDHVEVSYDGDVCILTVRGDYDLEVEAYFTHVRERLGERFGYRLTIMDVSQGGTITHRARMALARWNKRHRPPVSLAIVGASFAIRQLVNMILSAIRFLTGRRTEYSFFKTHEEARAWLDQERPRIQAVARAEGFLPQENPEGKT